MFWEILIESAMNEVGITSLLVFPGEISFVFTLNHRGTDETRIASVENVYRKVDKRLSKSCPKELAKKLETKNIRKKTKFL